MSFGWVEPFVAQYGYAAIFCLLMLGIVGPLIPDETIMVLAGILIRKGTLQPWGAFAAAFAGSVCGITMSYTLGRVGVAAILEKRRRLRDLETVQVWFNRYGPWTLFFGYFIVGVRHFTALAAGAMKLEPPTFAAYAYPGGLIWVITFLSLGYFVGDQWERWARYIHGGFLVAMAAVVVAGAAWYLIRRRSR